MPLPHLERSLQLGPKHVAAALFEIPEDQWFDRKSAGITARALADVLIGFANAGGGTVVVGLSDGNIEGTDRDPDRRNALLQAPLDFSVPPVATRHRLLRCERPDGAKDHLLVIEIQPAEGIIHANVKDEVFLRVGDENRRLTFAQRQELAFDRGHSTYESKTLTSTGMDDVDTTLLRRYQTRVGSDDPKRLMQARGLLTRNRLTVAGCLLFDRHPQRQLPEAYVRVLRYEGSERGAGASQRLLADHRLEGPIPRSVEAAREHIAKLQPTRKALGTSGRFEQIPLIPPGAWLEGLVNAVIHRSYSLAGDHIRVEIFDDRIEITSPGRFPGVVDLADPVNTLRFARNPRIARVCSDLEIGLELGEGIRRIYREMAAAGLYEPTYTQSAIHVRLTLRTELARPGLRLPSTREAQAVLEAVRTAGHLNTAQIAEVIGRSRPTTLRLLRDLERDKVIRRVGTSANDPRAYWEET